ncbi:LytR family transcriptional regulator [Micromonospora globispora]|uniref:LytR family transcriptional regulator n=1 Tax=Micromonospora globispora TaxID=1450148 RepID=A0A317KB42_9ACTN|nr:LCP family protein [Micromonospora globispora]PWU50422.1 LytR family transcriptional regulator [Micromonospora globispora]PWU60020.1 LytR family transcriptional regulator [Micromonospora globispora]RQW96998.1 LytR family transcriptional regulator [Micromonospora globispora]
MIEDELRAAFARHETLAPATAPIRAAIERTVVRRRRRRLRLRLGGTALALVVAALVGVPAMTPDRPQQTATLLLEPVPSTPTGALNLLLLGLDGASPGGGRRADSILLVHVPADRSRLYLVSLPRDLQVPIPGVGTNKLNSSFAYGSMAGKGDLTHGYDLTRRVVTEVTGVPIDGGAVLTYSALRKLTDAVGGVPVCLPQGIKSMHTRRVFPAGCQQLDGAASVDLLRQRHGLTDAVRDRDRNAQRYAAGLLRRIGERGGLTNPAMLHTLLTQAGSGLTVETGETSLPALLSVAGKAAAAEPVAVGLPVVYAEKPFFGFQLDRATAPAFLAALGEDRLSEWTAAHPDRVTGLR